MFIYVMSYFTCMKQKYLEEQSGLKTGFRMTWKTTRNYSEDEEQIQDVAFGAHFRRTEKGSPALYL